MAQFPTTDPKVVLLAQAMIAGYTSNPTVFPGQPFTPAQLQTLLDDYLAADADLNQAQAVMLAKSEVKTEKRSDLTDAMKSSLTVSSNTVHDNDAQMHLIGYSGRAAPTALTIPGQARNFEIVGGAGNSSPHVDWKKPLDGGKPAAYQVLYRATGSSAAWNIEGVATQTEAVLTNLPTTGRFDLCVVAFNDAGTGPQSNIVTMSV